MRRLDELNLENPGYGRPRLAELAAGIVVLVVGRSKSTARIDSIHVVDHSRHRVGETVGPRRSECRGTLIDGGEADRGHAPNHILIGDHRQSPTVTNPTFPHSHPARTLIIWQQLRGMDWAALSGLGLSRDRFPRALPWAGDGSHRWC